MCSFVTGMTSLFYVQAELGDTQAAASLYKQVALRKPQNWAAIQGYLDCIAPKSSTAAAANGAADLSSLSILANGSSTKEHVNGTAHGIEADSLQVCVMLHGSMQESKLSLCDTHHGIM